MEWRTFIFALMVVLLVIQIFVSSGVVAGSWKANMDDAGVIFPVLLLVGAYGLYRMKDSKSGLDIEMPKFNLSQ